MAEHAAQQSADITEASWIAPRLAAFHSGMATSVVPNGFEAYSRVLHPLEPVVADPWPARWAHVADWSGVPLAPGVHFPDIAFPEHEPTGAEPWPGQVPQIGALGPADRATLASLLTTHTGTPEHCWFCMWEGWGPEVDYPGPRVEHPGRGYVLFTGPLAALPSLADAHGHAPSLWWPEDRAWCVATEIDLAWSYVGGSARLLEEVLASPRLEAQPAAATEDFRQRVPQWLAPSIHATVDELLGSGTATLRTWRGSVHAQLRRPDGQADGGLSFQINPTVRRSGHSWRRVSERDPERLRDNVTRALTGEVIGLL